VLTPAVAAVVKAVRVKEPLPYLFICAFIANAASFVLPISNPANLVVFGAHMPPLARWLYHFTLPSIASIRRSSTARCWSAGIASASLHSILVSPTQRLRQIRLPLS